MAIPPEFVEELRNRLSIAQVVGRRVRLQKRGREHTGLCPFHNEKTPSFTVSDDKAFFHCLAGETAVNTRDGTQTIAALVGRTVEVLTRGQQWVKARFMSFGRQDLFRIELSRNGVKKTLFATSGHRWFTRNRSTAVLTTELRTGHRLESILPPSRTHWELSAQGVRHGIVFGERSVEQHGEKRYGTVNLHGEKATDLAAWLSDYEPGERVREGGESYLRVYGGRDFEDMKSLPLRTQDDDYLLGFLAGYLATDGHVAKDGTVILNCRDQDTLRQVRDIATQLGVGTFGITSQMRRGYLDRDTPIYRIHLVASTLVPEMFLRREARDRFARASKQFERLRWSVVSVAKSERTEEVYCAVVPEHHAFALEDNILTGNCFGCGAHGDVVGFVMRSEGLPFPEAVERLAREAGLEVPVSSPEERRKAEKQATLHGALESAARWFEEQLRGSTGRAGMDYFKRRGLRDETIDRFRLGYAPDDRNALKEALKKQGISEELQIEAGLAKLPDDGRSAFGYFRGRVMFPITDRRGRVIAFGGRILDQGEPKYLNSPETPLFHKGRVLYGLAQAQAAAREKADLIVCEGYMDVIALAEAGIGVAVAPLGTALTEDQILELWRLAPEPILCFDGDAAGQRAAARAIERALPLLAPGKSLRFAILPPGDDPDSLIRRGGEAAMAEALAQARPLVDAIWDQEIAARPADTPERRAGLRQRLEERIRRIADRPVQEGYRQEVNSRFAKAFAPARPAGSGRFAGQRPGRAPFGKGRPPGSPDPAAVGGAAARLGTQGLERHAEEQLLALVVNHPVLVSDKAEDLAHLALQAHSLDKLRKAIIDHAAARPDLDADELKRHLNQTGYAGTLQTLLDRTRDKKYTLPNADLAQAAEALSHLMRLLQERDARRERDEAARRLGEEGTPESFARFDSARRATLEGESKRRDIDGPDDSGTVPVRPH